MNSRTCAFLTFVIGNILLLPLMLTSCIWDMCPIYKPVKIVDVLDPKFKTLYDRPDDETNLSINSNHNYVRRDRTHKYGSMSYRAKLSNGETCPNRMTYNIHDEMIYNNLIKNPSAIRGEKILMSSVAKTCHYPRVHWIIGVVWFVIAIIVNTYMILLICIAMTHHEYEYD